MANVIKGTDKNDNLKGSTGSDDIDGLTGADTMTGGIGDDVYRVDNAGDKVIEAKNSGSDTIISSIDYSLLKNAEVENLVLAEHAIKATGNALANTIIGNDENNIIDGGKGADFMLGGKGDDTYRFDDTQDGVIENAGEGRDHIISTVGLSNAFGNVEDYTFNTTKSLNFTGNDLDNLIISGSGDDTIAGGAGFDNIDGGKGADRMTGGTGSDIYHVDNVKDVVIELAGEGSQDTIISSVSLGVLADNVETALLAGKAGLHLSGNGLDNHLFGNDGANVIDGGKGVDVMIGGLGDDVYVVSDPGDIAIEGKNAGNDTVKSAIDFTLGNDIETLILTGKDDIDGRGNALGNHLIGNDGDNVLNGDAGKDVMEGGKGDDRYVVDDKGDKVVETLSQEDGGGADVVNSSIDFSLAGLANVENLVLTDGAIAGTGNALRNFIFGNDNDNEIDGGKGDDFMEGGAGSDTYLIDNAGDFIIEDPGEGVHDKVVSTILLSNAFDQVEDYVFNVTKSLDFTANERSNEITGGSGNDFIDGKAGSDVIDGGKGADTMVGGTESDVYIVDNVGDKVVENFNEGFDVIRSSVSIALLADNVEQVELQGSGALNVTGNVLDNVIFGNAGANVIDGGAGADEMRGEAGNDTYFVGNPGDVIVEFENSGTDLVKSAIDFTLGDNVENLTLIGADDLKGTGNALANVITGNSGNNTLDGAGGKDTLIGGEGDDVYIVHGAGEKIVESISNANGGGNDTVVTTGDFSLAGLVNVDRSVMDGYAIANRSGYALNNTLVGGNGVNTLDGGKGDDVLIGGGGNDTYVIDSIHDLVFDSSGFDRIISTVGFSNALDSIEDYEFNLSTAINFTGNTANNTIAGGSAGDTLTGGGGFDLLEGRGGNDHLIGGSDFDILDGGTGADIMQGFGNDDEYFVDNAKDQVIESSNQGVDTVRATISITDLFDNVENVVFDGKSNLAGTGNSLANFIEGNDGNNALNGAGGDDVLQGERGNDTLTGGAGSDMYVLSLFPGNKAGHDTITDFIRGEDVLEFNSVPDGNANGIHLNDIGDLIALTDKVVDHGAGKAVDIFFEGGTQVTLIGIGTGQIHSIQDLVNSNVHIEVNTLT